MVSAWLVPKARDVEPPYQSLVTQPIENHTKKPKLSEPTSVTLSFGGVDFCLSPSDSILNGDEGGENGQPLFSISKSKEGMKIYLSKFSGSLTVSSALPSVETSPETNRYPQRNTIDEDVGIGERVSDVKDNVCDNLGNEECGRIDDPSLGLSQLSRNATPSPPSSPEKNEEHKCDEYEEMMNSLPPLNVPLLKSEGILGKDTTSSNVTELVTSNKNSCSNYLTSMAIRPDTKVAPNIVPPSVTKKRARNSSPCHESFDNSRKERKHLDLAQSLSTKSTENQVPQMNSYPTFPLVQHHEPKAASSDQTASGHSYSSYDLLMSQRPPSSPSSQTCPSSVDNTTKDLSLITQPKLPTLAPKEIPVQCLSEVPRKELSSEKMQRGQQRDFSLSSTSSNQEVEKNNSVVELLDSQVCDGDRMNERNVKEKSTDLVVPPTTELSAEESLRTPNYLNPAPRWGHTLNSVSNDRLILYGGQSLVGTLSDIHVYSLSNRTWSKPVNCSGLPRCWHSSTFIPSRNLLLVYGGESINPKTGKAVTTDQIMVLDTDIMLWYPPVCSGVKPNARSGHSASLLPSTLSLVVFGGVRRGKWLNTCLVLDVTRWKWSSPKISGEAPRPRSYHTATPISGNRIVIFGGNDGKRSFGSVHVLDAGDGDGDHHEWRWIHPKTVGAGPCARTGHSATLLEDGVTILLHGGWDPSNDDDEKETERDEELVFDDTFLLDTRTWTWTEGPKGRYGGGGVFKGEKRVGHAGALVEGSGGGKVLLFGGRTPGDDFGNDLQIFC